MISLMVQVESLKANSKVTITISGEEDLMIIRFNLMKMILKTKKKENIIKMPLISFCLDLLRK